MSSNTSVVPSTIIFRDLPEMTEDDARGACKFLASMTGASHIKCDTQEGTLEIVLARPPALYPTLKEFVHTSIIESRRQQGEDDDFDECDYYDEYDEPGGFTDYGGLAGAACSLHFADRATFKGILYMEDLDGNQSFIDGPVVARVGEDEMYLVDELSGGPRAQERAGRALQIDESHPQSFGHVGNSLHFLSGEIRKDSGVGWKGFSTKTSAYLDAGPSVRSRLGEFRSTVVSVV
jgi:hypothetical protein